MPEQSHTDVDKATPDQAIATPPLPDAGQPIQASRPTKPKYRFWPLVGLALGADLILALVYTVIFPGFTGRAFSDALCNSALFLGLLSVLPVMVDAGRGLGVATKMAEPEAARNKALIDERRRREQGIVITFALVMVTFLVTLLSFLIAML